MNWELTISGIALLISAISFVLSYTFNRRNAVLSKQPVIVFEYDEEAGWRLRNIGSGPALNILIALKGKNSDWSYPVRIPALSSGGEYTLKWIGRLNAWILGATYKDFQGRSYTSVSQHDENTVEDGILLPKFPESTIRRHWNAEDVSSESSLT